MQAQKRFLGMPLPISTTINRMKKEEIIAFFGRFYAVK